MGGMSGMGPMATGGMNNMNNLMSINMRNPDPLGLGGPGMGGSALPPAAAGPGGPMDLTNIISPGGAGGPLGLGR